MADWLNYKGIEVPEATPTGTAGLNLKNDLTELADRAPNKSAANPTSNDDADDGYFAGSLWLNSSTQVMWVCTDATSGSAAWKTLYERESGAVVLSPGADGSVTLGDDLDVNGKSIVSQSNGDIPISPNGSGQVVLDGLNWPTSDGSANQLLKTDGAGNLSWATGGGGGGTPAGANQDVQFNDSGSFGGDSNFTFDKTTDALTITGSAQVDNVKLDGNTISSTDTNGPIIVSPNGAGSIQADSGGDARGNNAVDFQSFRNLSTEIASAKGAFVAGGKNNTASGKYSHASGGSTTASGYYAHAEGSYNVASGNSAHAEGNTTTASASTAHAEGYSTTASGINSHAEGGATGASAEYAHSEGFDTTASGKAAHAEGWSTTASGDYSHAEGYQSGATNYNCHAEGVGTLASGYDAHAEGVSTVASGDRSHAQGYASVASGETAHAEGNVSYATGSRSHAGGSHSKAHLTSQWSRASGGHSNQIGSAQSTHACLFRRTTDGSATELTLGGGTPSSTSRFVILDGQTLSCLVNIVGRKENGGTNDHASFLRQLCIRREGTTTALVGTVQTVGADINPAGWGGVTITADDTNESLKISVTGVSSTNIRWTGTVYASEVADAAI